MSEAAIIPSSGQVKTNRGAILGSAVIVSGTATGAGMFSMPVATSGMWFVPSLLMLLFVWFCMYSASLYLLEANMRFPIGASFDSIAEKTIGNIGRLINGLSVGFVCYVLTYAYISGGSSIISHSLKAVADITLAPSYSSLIFAVVLSSIVVLGTRAVDRVTTALLGGMVISFLGFTSGLVTQAESQLLFPALQSSDTLPYAFAALSFVTVSFGFQNCVPSITRYLKKDAHAVRKALLWGSLITLVFYIVWLISIFGNLGRDQFPAVIAQGGNIGSLIRALEANGLQSGMSNILQLFSNMAVASSFLGVSLSLFDYIADLFGFGHDLKGRLKTAAVTFIPPTLLGVLLPNGFIAAIAFAGVGMEVFCIITPVLMAWVGRKNNAEGYQVSGGKLRMMLVMGFGILSLVLAALDSFSLLPWFGK
ncbi:aromatic amino acid transporter [Endozoicomonas sp. Mp262]|uniref:aromatic amino acid transporter n=1 Tax=Endozoicomonas sp. Mp262 TaxID=2919499 RepID=UPI0021DFE05D